jgi:hypothetical protein
MLCAIPLDLDRGETKGVWLRRVGPELGIGYSLARRLYYRLTDRMDADTLTVMRERFQRYQQRAQSLSDINQRIEALKAGENRHKEESDAIRRSLGESDAGLPVAGRPAGTAGDQDAASGGVVPRPDEAEPER